MTIILNLMLQSRRNDILSISRHREGMKLVYRYYVQLGTERIAFLDLEQKCWTASVERKGAHPGFEHG